MHIVLQLLCLTLLGTMAISANPLEQLWRGNNGKAFRGTFVAFNEDRSTATFDTSTGKRVTVAVANLIPQHRDILLGTVRRPAPTPPPAPQTGGGFKTLPEPDRSLVPKLAPKDFGSSDQDMLTTAVWSAFLWWDQTGLLEVPGRGNFNKRAENLHEQFARDISKGGRGAASLEDAKAAVEKHFAEHHAETAACRVNITPSPIDSQKLAAALTGANAVILNMTTPISPP